MKDVEKSWQEVRSRGKSMEVLCSSYRQTLSLDPIASQSLNLETSATRLARFTCITTNAEDDATANGIVRICKNMYHRDVQLATDLGELQGTNLARWLRWCLGLGEFFQNYLLWVKCYNSATFDIVRLLKQESDTKTNLWCTCHMWDLQNRETCDSSESRNYGLNMHNTNTHTKTHTHMLWLKGVWSRFLLQEPAVF